jgi:hypothetical protein
MGYYAEQARIAESNGKWSEAYLAWICEGGDYALEQAKACKTIATATELGDRFREKVKEAYSKLKEYKISIYEYIDELNKAHDEVYNN